MERTGSALTRRVVLGGLGGALLGGGPPAGTAAATGRLVLAPAGPVRAPSVVSRAGWHADERLAWWRPVRTPTVAAVVVHHTASGNGYSRAGAPAAVRDVFRYHAATLNWGDIGYHFLVDRYGTVYEGRKGGAGDPVVGGHCYGFNHATLGIGLLGTFDAAAPPAPVRAALAHLLTWLLARYHRDPRGTGLLVVDDRKNPWHPHPGTTVRAAVVGGHRDLYPTDCCGAGAYAVLPALRAEVDRLLGVCFVDPVLAVSGSTLTVTARSHSATRRSRRCRPPTPTARPRWSRPRCSACSPGCGSRWTWGRCPAGPTGSRWCRATRWAGRARRSA